MKLTGQEPGVIFQLNYFDQVSIWRQATEFEPSFFQLNAIPIIEFIPVPMPFIYLSSSISFISVGFFSQLTGIFAKPHGATLIPFHTLIGQQVNDEVWRIGSELGAIRFL